MGVSRLIIPAWPMCPRQQRLVVGLYDHPLPVARRVTSKGTQDVVLDHHITPTSANAQRAPDDFAQNYGVVRPGCPQQDDLVIGQIKYHSTTRQFVFTLRPHVGCTNCSV